MDREFRPRKIVVGDNTMIGANSYVNAGVTIGSNCVVAPGTAVFVDIPDNKVVSGGPMSLLTESMKVSIRAMRHADKE